MHALPFRAHRASRRSVYADMKCRLAAWVLPEVAAELGFEVEYAADEQGQRESHSQVSMMMTAARLPQVLL